RLATGGAAASPPGGKGAPRPPSSVGVGPGRWATTDRRPGMKLSGPHGEAPRILVIAGMHRSGTSLLAELASEAGFDMGARLLPAGPGNRGGHFEDLDFLDFHDAAFAARGAAPLAVAPDFRFAPAAAEMAAAQELLRQRQAKPRWGFKDPRATLFLDFWAERLPEARFLLLYRHPVAVL